jgi:tetratricopeptide (TPR) repeat protein
VHSGPLYKVKHQSGRILGPLDQERIRKLIQKNQITGVEIAKAYPVGDWQDINRFPELAELLLTHASGNQEASKGTLKSDQSSYQPILSPTQDPFAATVVLPQIPRAIILDSTVQVKPVDSDATRVETEDQDKTWLDARAVEETKTVQVSQEQKLEMESISPGEVRGTEIQIVPGQSDLALDFPDVLADPKYKKLLTEATIFVNRPGLKPAQKKFKIPSKKELFRIIAISVALGYFGYDSFLKDDPNNSAAKFLQKSEAFRPTIPKILEGKKADPKLSQSLYAEGMKYFALDHVQGYKAAAARFSQAIQSDPESVKASAMLASAYINLIDTSTKDENFFSVISRLIDTAKAKGNDIPEIVIAEVEFLTATGRPDAAVQRIVSYTKGRPVFDPSLFVYISEALLAKGNAKEASRYIQNFPDNQAWSPRIFFLRGRISEELGDISGARENFDKALKGWPVHAKSRLRKVYLAWQAGTISKSEEDLLLLLKHPDFLSPRDLGQANYFLSQYYSVKQNFEGALSAIRRALTLDRQNRDYLLEYYTLLGREGGSVPEAKVEAKMYLFLSEGEKLIKKGKPNEALGQFLNARTENPKSNPAH